MTRQLAIGLMSGTSADGITAALASFEGKKFSYLGMINHAYPSETVKKIRRGAQLTANELSSLDQELGELFARTANDLLRKLHVKPAEIACIGSHGQTIYHGPRDPHPNTLQIADPFMIAEKTGITTISHFRQRDIVVGGEGAPLIPYFDHYFFGDGPVRAFQNIGGIANVTIVGKNLKEPLAFDTGPGNGLMDAAMRIITHGAENHDHHGGHAKRGQLHMEILNAMLQHDYFKRPPPKSTGLEMFGEKFVTDHFGSLLETNPNDVLATLNQLTSITIQESYRNYVFKNYPIEEVIVSGGGVHNKTLFKKLGCLFAPIEVKSIESFGIPVQAKEPLAFAFFGLRRLQNKINHLPQCTGAKKTCSLGSIVHA